MLLDRRSIAMNICRIPTIYLNTQQIINGILYCALIKNEIYKKKKKIYKRNNKGINNKLLKYYLIITNLYDIVSRGVNAPRDKIPPPQLEQINTTIKHTRISLFENVSKVIRNIAIAIVSQNASSAVYILLCKIFESEVIYAK